MGVIITHYTGLSG